MTRPMLLVVLVALTAAPLVDAAESPASDVARLVAAVRAGGDLHARGDAVLALAAADDDDARAALGELDDDALPPLVRTWVRAARVQTARDLEELLALAPLLDEAPALERPFAARAKALVSSTGAEAERAVVERLLEAGREQASAQRALFGAVTHLGVEPLSAIASTGEPPALRRAAAEHLASLAARAPSPDLVRALAALADTPLADPPRLASVDDPRAWRERDRAAYVFSARGLTSVVVQPRVRHDEREATMLLALPSRPVLRTVPPDVLDGLAVVSGLEPSPVQERTPLLPRVYADAEVVVFERELDAVSAWLRARGVNDDERAITTAKEVLREGGVLVGVASHSPAAPVALRLRGDAAPVRDLLADDDDSARTWAVGEGDAAPREGRLVKRLSPEELTSAMRGDDVAVGHARELIASDVAAAREEALLREGERSGEALVALSRRLGLSGPDVAPLLPRGAPRDAERAVTLHVVEGPAAPAVRPDGDEEQRRPIVERFEDNRVFRLLEKIWD